MKAFHSFWSKPNSARGNGVIHFPDFELLTAILSAVKWQQKNGEIKMITDSDGAAFFESIGLHKLWDEMDVSLDRIDSGIDPFLFWAAGKLYALQSMETPCVMLDTDLIVWHTLNLPEDVDVVAAHPEGINPIVYPDPATFPLKESYQYPEEWDFTLPAANTAFLYMKDPAFRDYYVKSAMEFFGALDGNGMNPVTAMCFAEQRVLPMCCNAKTQKLDFLMMPQELEGQTLLTHTWGFKEVLHRSPGAYEEYCMRLTNRILTDAPEKEELLQKCKPLRKYYDKWKMNQ